MVQLSLLPHVEALHADGMMSNVSSDTAAFAMFRQLLLYSQQRHCMAQAFLLFK